MQTIRVAVMTKGALSAGGAELIESWQQTSDDLLWVDVLNPTNDELEPLLEGRFGFHELASEDSLSPNPLPKHDAFENYDFFVFRSVDIDLRAHEAQTDKLSAFLGRNFLVTVHRGTLHSIDDVCNRLPGDARLLSNGPDFLLHSLVDQMVDAQFPLLDEFEECVDTLQEAIFCKPSPDHLDELLHLKRDLNVLRRNSLPQRELLNLISRGDTKYIQQKHLIYFRDVYDHMFRISETIDLERDMLSGTMEAYLSVIANRTNEIMKVLTVFSAIMLPLTLIAGIYGMNFAHEPELQWKYGYWYALSLMGVTAIGMLLWFRRRGWIGHFENTRPRRMQRSKS